MNDLAPDAIEDGITARHRPRARAPVHLVLFDVLHLAGRSLLRVPYARRRGRLEELGLGGPGWSTPAALVGHGAEALRATREHGLEGLVQAAGLGVRTRGARPCLDQDPQRAQ